MSSITSNIGQYEFDTKAKYIAEAKAASSFLDSVFLIHYHNTELAKWGTNVPRKNIEPAEVFDCFDLDLYKDALRKSERLLNGNALVGMAFHKYESVRVTFDEAVEMLRNGNPGFDSKSYEMTINASK